jgi:hypothetical protein
VGTLKRTPGGGQALYLGFRPRDDQAASTGVEARAWFEILHRLGAYPASGVFEQDDNPAVISRTSPFLACAFPNGAVALAPHFRTHEENWPGGFFRKPEEDAAALQENPLPADRLELVDFQVAGQSVTYTGRHAVAWRRGENGELPAFAGTECTGIRLDGQVYTWSEAPVDIAWHPLRPDQHMPGIEALYRVWVNGEGRVCVPLGLEPGAGLEVWLGTHLPAWQGRRRSAPTHDYARAGYGLRAAPFALLNGDLVLEVDDRLREHWLYVVKRA